MMFELRLSHSGRLIFFIFVLFHFSLLSLLPHLSQAREKKLPADPLTDWGIEIITLRQTAAGRMLDLRFRVIDPAKASYVLSSRNRVYIVDLKSGKALGVPITKAGPMRQTTLSPEAGRTYFTLFSNPGGLVGEGSKVALVVGDFSFGNIIIESVKSKPETVNRDLSTLPESKRKRWKNIRMALHDEYGVCVEHCGGDSECIEKCRKALASREEREFQQLLFE